MVKDKNTKPHDGLADVEEALTKTEQFLEKNLKPITYGVVGVIVAVLVFLAIQRWVVSPKGIEAQEELYMAQEHFNKDSFNLALNGDGNSLGFLDIIDNYGSTKAGKLSRYYAGISYLHLGDFQNAISYLEKFKTDDLLLEPLKHSAIGDAYVELGDMNKAISAYKKALSANTNDFTTPLVNYKLGLVYEELKQTSDALKCYQEVKDKYPSSNEAMNIDKAIARVSQL